MKSKVIFVIIIILICAGAYCGYRYYHDDILPEKAVDDANSEQMELFSQVRPEHDPDGSDPLKKAEEVNPAVVGWITIDGTHIDYPICQADDNDFYLHHGFDGELNNELGCPFLDYRCENDFSGFNSIVYGHHMSQQRMFADIALFKDKAFLQSHPSGTLTMKDGEHSVRFFAYMNTTNTAPTYHAVFLSKSEKEEYIDYIFSDAQYTAAFTSDELKERDDLHLLLLSTCTYEFTDARGILIGVIDQI
ncbi:MAG TPA: class B sortase [Ruminococcus sp.]|nr:class B sortase [Ruminococcus sp.]